MSVCFLFASAARGPYLAFFWLALRTLTSGVFVEATIRSLKIKRLGGVQKTGTHMLCR